MNNLSLAQKIAGVIFLSLIVVLICIILLDNQSPKKRLLKSTKTTEQLTTTKSEVQDNLLPTQSEVDWSKQPKYIELDRILTEIEEIIEEDRKIYAEIEVAFCLKDLATIESLQNRQKIIQTKMYSLVGRVEDWAAKHGKTDRYKERTSKISSDVIFQEIKWKEFAENPASVCS